MEQVTVVVHREREGFWSEVDELPGCFATGRTLDELTEAVGEAVGLYLRDDAAVRLPETLPGVGVSKVRISAV